MAERRIRVRRLRPAEGLPGGLPAEARGQLTEAVDALRSELIEELVAEAKARMEIVAAAIPEGEEQELVIRPKRVPPFFEVTTRRV